MANGTGAQRLPGLSQRGYGTASGMAPHQGYRTAPLASVSAEAHRREIAETANRAVSGKTNNVGQLSLAVAARATTVIDRRVSPQSWIGLAPLTQNAAADWATGTTWVWQRLEGSFTLLHAESPVSDRDYAYVVIG